MTEDCGYAVRTRSFSRIRWSDRPGWRITAASSVSDTSSSRIKRPSAVSTRQLRHLASTEALGVSTPPNNESMPFSPTPLSGGPICPPLPPTV